MKFTLCFLTRGDQVLMLCRRRAPNQGLWNGVGGRIEPGETPLESCLREVHEETGFSIECARFSALVSWTGFETPDSALGVFTALAPLGDPVPCDEGELAWRPRNWVLSSPDVVSNIHRYGPEVFAGLAPRWHRFTYSSGAIASHEIFPLPAPVGAYAQD